MYSRIDDYLIQFGFNKSLSETTLYIKVFIGGDLIIISLYVDYLFVIGSKSTFVNQFKDQIKQVFEMTDLREMAYFLGREINQSE